jgi:DNA-binding CsgD family transcriptional regulator
VIIEVDGLSARSALELVAILLGEEPGPGLTQLASRARGNPLYLIEIVRAAIEGELQDSADDALPRDFNAAVARSLGHLSDEARRFLEYSAMFGVDVPASALGGALGASPAYVLDRSGEPDLAAILATAPAGLAFRHELVRTAIYEGIPPDRRRAMHRSIGLALALEEPAPSTAGNHLALAATADDTHVISSLAFLVDKYLAVIPDGVASWLEIALERVGPHGPFADRLTPSLLRALILSGDVAKAEVRAREFLIGPVRGHVRSELMLSLSQSLLLQGRLPESLATLTQAISQQDAPGTHHLRLLAEVGFRLVLSGQSREGTEVAHDVLSTTLPVDAPASSLARITLGHALFYDGYLRDADRHARDAASEIQTAGDEESRRRVLFELGMFHVHVDDLDEAARVFANGVVLSSDRAGAWEPMFTQGLGFVQYQSGAWDEAVRNLAVPPDGRSTWESALFASTLADIYVHRGSLDKADEVLRPLESDFNESAPHYLADLVLWARAKLLDATGDADAAYRHRRRAAELIERWGVPIRYRHLAPDLVKDLLSRGKTTEAARIVRLLEDVAQRAKVAYVSGAAMRCRGLVEGDIATMHAAVAEMRSSGRPLELALTAEDAGNVAVSLDLHDDAASLYAEAAATLTPLGASWDLARIRAALRALGVTNLPRGPKSRGVQGWGSLTPAERDVARLAADGLRNAEIAAALFITVSTVETHLTRAYAKLGMKNRSQLTAFVARASTPDGLLP